MFALAACMSSEKRKCSRWPLILVTVSSLLWSKKLKVQVWAPSRPCVKDVQIYKHVGSRDTFSWRVNMLCLVYTTTAAAARDRCCLIPGWLGIILSCTVQAATLHCCDTYLNVLSLCNLYSRREVRLQTMKKSLQNVPWIHELSWSAGSLCSIKICLICIFGEVSNCKVTVMEQKVIELQVCSCFLGR